MPSTPRNTDSAANNGAMVLRPATLDDCLGLLPRLRAVDRTEIALSGSDPETCLREAWTRGAITEAICTADGAVVGVWGVVLLEPIGSIWMLGTPEIAKVSRAFIRACQTSVDAAQERFPRLGCLSWDGNVAHRKWLRWLGFEATSIKHNGFTYFERRPLPARTLH